MNKWERRIAASIILSSTILLAACGGGSSSSSGGSSFDTAKSSSIVIQLPGSQAMLGEPHRQIEGVEAISVAIADLLVGKAWAQMESVYVDGVLVGETTNGYLAVAVTPGDHWVCVNYTGVTPPLPADAGYCTMVNAPGDGVVTVTIDSFDDTSGCTEPGCYLVGTEVAVEPFDIAFFEDPNKSNHTIVCHKPGTPAEKSLSMGTPAAEAGHMVHGDALGACPPDVPAAPSQTVDGPVNDTGSGNNGNNENDNRCNKGKPNKKGCPSSDQA